MKTDFSLKSLGYNLSIYLSIYPHFCVTASPLPRFKISRRIFRYLNNKRQGTDKALRRFLFFLHPGITEVKK